MDHIELKEGQLVIVVGGLQKISEGPRAGEFTFIGARIYVGKHSVGMLQGFRFEAVANEAVPRVSFNWGTVMPAAFDGKAKPNDLAPLRAVYTHNVDIVRKNLPWVSYTSPVGNFDPLTYAPEDSE